MKDPIHQSSTAHSQQNGSLVYLFTDRTTLVCILSLSVQVWLYGYSNRKGRAIQVHALCWKQYLQTFKVPSCIHLNQGDNNIIHFSLVKFPLQPYTNRLASPNIPCEIQLSDSQAHYVFNVTFKFLLYIWIPCLQHGQRIPLLKTADYPLWQFEQGA